MVAPQSHNQDPRKEDDRSEYREHWPPDVSTELIFGDLGVEGSFPPREKNLVRRAVYDCALSLAEPGFSPAHPDFDDWLRSLPAFIDQTVKERTPRSEMSPFTSTLVRALPLTNLLLNAAERCWDREKVAASSWNVFLTKRMHETVQLFGWAECESLSMRSSSIWRSCGFAAALTGMTIAMHLVGFKFGFAGPYKWLDSFLYVCPPLAAATYALGWFGIQQFEWQGEFLRRVKRELENDIQIKLDLGMDRLAEALGVDYSMLEEIMDTTD